MSEPAVKLTYVPYTATDVAFIEATKNIGAYVGAARIIYTDVGVCLDGDFEIADLELILTALRKFKEGA